MVYKPRLLRVGALEEAVARGAVVAVGAGEDTPVVLAPGAGEVGRGRAVPREEADAVVGRPAVGSGVGDVGLAVEVERGGGLVDRGAVPFEGEGRLGDHVYGARE